MVWKNLVLMILGSAMVSDAVQAAEPITFQHTQKRDAEMFQQPQVAVAGSEKTYVAFGGGKSIFCATSRDGGKTFAPPIRVATLSSLMLGSRRGPRIAASGNNAVIVAIGDGGNLHAWRSADAGQNWQGPTIVNDIPQAAREGLHALAAGPEGELYCVWLDLRNDSPEVYGSRSSDGGQTWSNNQRIYHSPDGNVCECCHPSVTFDSEGTLYVMWRNWLDGRRDMYLSASKDGGRTFSPAKQLGRGNWRIDHCPMDGGAVAVGRPGQIATIWRRENSILATLPEKPNEVHLGQGEQPWTAANTKGIWTTWISHDGGELVLQRLDQRRSEVVARNANDPVLAASLNGEGPIVLAWEEGPRKDRRIRVQVVSSN